MSNYVDGFVLPVSKKKLPAYRRMAQKVSRIWKEYGALDYKECVGDDLDSKMGLPFPRVIKCKTGETIVFAYIVYKSRAHRDSVCAKLMKDPRLEKICNGKNMPFDPSRMLYGGFKVMVSL
jgi:uncharacterized protein YbaA (DUF1428 family)